MILDIPTEADFVESGVSFLNLAWDSAVDLVLDLQESQISETEDAGTITDEYWARAQRPLATAVTLAQQGTEFLLKARIAQVSPFLLLCGTPREWPKGSDRSDCSYAEFRSLDAQDLLRVHDTVSPVRLSTEFRIEFERVRRVRNSLVHTIRKHQRFAAGEVLKWILQARLELAPDRTWIHYRRNYLEIAHPGGAFPDYDGVGWGNRIARELRAAMDSLSSAECAILLNIPSKKQRFYYCLGCHWHKVGLESHVKTAQLRPNAPDSTSLYCYACEETEPVQRAECGICPGNVIDEEGSYCLSCGDFKG